MEEYVFGLIGADGFGRRDHGGYGNGYGDHCCGKTTDLLGFETLNTRLIESEINGNTNSRFNEMNDNLNRNAMMGQLGRIGEGLAECLAA